MRCIIAFLVVLAAIATTAHAQQRTVTINRNISFRTGSGAAERLGYAQVGLTAFLALLDSATGVRPSGTPAPGYPFGQIYPGLPYGAVIVAPPVVLDGAVICDDPSWCTWPSPLGPGPGADGFIAGFRAGQQWARERRIVGALQYHRDVAVGTDLGAATGW